MTSTASGRSAHPGSLHDQTSQDQGGVTERRVERRVGLPSGRAVVGGLLMALAAVGTFLAYTAASADDSIEVLVASRALRAGHVVTADDVELVAVEVPGTVRGLFGTTEAAVGRQIVGPVDAGEFLLASATTVPTEGSDTLEVSVSLPASRTVAGLRPGERVDVFSTWSSDRTELIAVDARVLEVRGGATTVLGGGEPVLVRLALHDFSQVEALVHAQAAGDLTMIGATIGGGTEDLGREYRPGAGVRARATTGEDGG